MVAAVTKAFTAPKYTMLFDAVALKLLPVIVTVVPGAPAVGEKEVITGGGPAIKVNPVFVPVPPGVVTFRSPVLPGPTAMVIPVAEVTVNAAAGVLPRLTAIAPVKLVPVAVMMPPVVEVVGENAVTVGCAKKVNPLLLPEPTEVVTLILPVDPVPTIATRLVAVPTVKEAAWVPPKVTLVVPVKLVPVMVITVPTPASTGVKEVMVGGPTI